jgi:hypothetical protein
MIKTDGQQTKPRRAAWQNTTALDGREKGVRGRRMKGAGSAMILDSGNVRTKKADVTG